jgi:DNA repair exonuclease SbcCD ATPase subunit
MLPLLSISEITHARIHLHQPTNLINELNRQIETIQHDLDDNLIEEDTAVEFLNNQNETILSIPSFQIAQIMRQPFTSKTISQQLASHRYTNLIYANTINNTVDPKDQYQYLKNIIKTGSIPDILKYDFYAKYNNVTYFKQQIAVLLLRLMTDEHFKPITLDQLNDRLQQVQFYSYSKDYNLAIPKNYNDCVLVSIFWALHNIRCLFIIKEIDYIVQFLPCNTEKILYNTKIYAIDSDQTRYLLF